MFPDSSIAIPPPVSQAKQETSNSGVYRLH